MQKQPYLLQRENARIHEFVNSVIHNFQLLPETQMVFSLDMLLQFDFN